MEINDFLDYREYLKQFYDERKKRESWFSIRLIAGKVKMDPGLVQKVLQGTRHITEKHIPAFCKLCGLGIDDVKYFEALVRFNKAKSDKEIKLAFEKVIQLKGLESRILEKYQYEFYQKWYYNAVRSLISISSGPITARQVAGLLAPAITTTQAKEALALLVKLKMISKNKNGSYVLKDKFITTGKSWRSIAVRDFQKEYMDLGRESLDRFSKELRDISTVTVTVAEDKMEDLRAILQECRNNIMKMAGKNTDRVYQLNMQLFPLTEKLNND